MKMFNRCVNGFQTRGLEARLNAIASKYRGYHMASLVQREAMLNRIMNGLVEKITLPDDYP